MAKPLIVGYLQGKLTLWEVHSVSPDSIALGIIGGQILGLEKQLLNREQHMCGGVGRSP